MCDRFFQDECHLRSKLPIVEKCSGRGIFDRREKTDEVSGQRVFGMGFVGLTCNALSHERARCYMYRCTGGLGVMWNVVCKV